MYEKVTVVHTAEQMVEAGIRVPSKAEIHVVTNVEYPTGISVHDGMLWVDGKEETLVILLERVQFVRAIKAEER